MAVPRAVVAVIAAGELFRDGNTDTADTSAVVFAYSEVVGLVFEIVRTVYL